MATDCNSMQLIDYKGEFDVAGLESFMKSVKLPECGVSYAVVAIMGPQSSGKSTLLNNLFCTDFKEMDAAVGREQTTLGIWIAKAVEVEPLTIVMDIEGNDGQERGKDQTFEKQTALFALVLADVVMINIWCSDIGRENGAGKPLLRTVFEVMTRLFPPRKTTLLFVIRDKPIVTPVELLAKKLQEAMHQIWEAIKKPESCASKQFSDFFIVRVVGLPNYEHQKEEFKLEVAKLKAWFINSVAPGGLAGDRQDCVPASAFSLSAQKMWKDVRKNKDLDLPDHNVMLASVRCDEIANKKYALFCADKGWLALADAAKSGSVSGFGQQLTSLLKTHLSEYDKETMYFHEGVCDAKRNHLKSYILQFVHPFYTDLLEHLRSQGDERFQAQLDKELSTGKGFAASVRDCMESCMLEFDRQYADATVGDYWNASNVRENLKRDMERHSSSLRREKFYEIHTRFDKKVSETIEGLQIEAILKAGQSDHSWPSIRKNFKRAIDALESDFLDSLSGLELDASVYEDKLKSLRGSARILAEKKARDVAKTEVVFLYMKERFFNAFTLDENSIPRGWNKNEDIEKIASDARRLSLEMLSVMAAIRFDESPDNIKDILFNCLLNQSASHSSTGTGASADSLSSSTWEEVSLNNTLITPVECMAMWDQFQTDIGHIVTQATVAQATEWLIRLHILATLPAVSIFTTILAANKHRSAKQSGTAFSKMFSAAGTLVVSPFHIAAELCTPRGFDRSS